MRDWLPVWFWCFGWVIACGGGWRVVVGVIGFVGFGVVGFVGFGVMGFGAVVMCFRVAWDFVFVWGWCNTGFCWCAG